MKKTRSQKLASELPLDHLSHPPRIDRVHNLVIATDASATPPTRKTAPRMAGAAVSSTGQWNAWHKNVSPHSGYQLEHLSLIAETMTALRAVQAVHSDQNLLLLMDNASAAAWMDKWIHGSNELADWMPPEGQLNPYIDTLQVRTGAIRAQWAPRRHLLIAAADKIAGVARTQPRRAHSQRHLFDRVAASAATAFLGGVATQVA